MGQIMKSSDEKKNLYDLVSRVNHWALALLIVGMLVFGFYVFEFVPRGPGKGALIGLHKSIGFVILVLGIWRVGWRLAQGFKRDTGTSPLWQHRVARAAHVLLLAGVIIMPLSGITGAYFSGRVTSVFGLFSLPVGEKTESLAEIAYGAHVIAAYSISFVLILHVAGALKHHFIDRDATLKRMLGKS
ncbi:cytochrome b [Candidatus Halocynthiibacter alkanivorans]|uniref:cytochrome b n=1 Tax=Candidatus Halocynthiibacter alkanivorans TaxID=2267619 RepID=UPI00190F9C58|nr:cytochrome b [Candidatus Halocynthiibacter alkanivorans]